MTPEYPAECLKHSGHEARINALEDQTESLNRKMDGLSGKLNLILGGVMILWPMVQVLMWFIKGSK